MVAARDLEAKLEGAMRELAAAKAADGACATVFAPLADADLDDLLMLATTTSLPSSTPSQQRIASREKEIVRTVVQRVSIVERTPECVVATVNWNDGADGAVLRILWDAHAHRRIAEFAASRGVAQGDLHPPRGGNNSSRGGEMPWTPNAVGLVLRRKHISR